MTMDDGEIVRSYRTARDGQKQIEVLAQLNMCGKEKIEEILTRHGELERKRRARITKEMETQMMEAHAEGKTDGEIREQFGLGVATVRNWRRRHGLKANRKKGEDRPMGRLRRDEDEAGEDDRWLDIDGILEAVPAWAGEGSRVAAVELICRLAEEYCGMKLGLEDDCDE